MVTGQSRFIRTHSNRNWGFSECFQLLSLSAVLFCKLNLKFSYIIKKINTTWFCFFGLSVTHLFWATRRRLGQKYMNAKSAERSRGVTVWRSVMNWLGSKGGLFFVSQQWQWRQRRWRQHCTWLHKSTRSACAAQKLLLWNCTSQDDLHLWKGRGLYIYERLQSNEGSGSVFIDLSTEKRKVAARTRVIATQTLASVSKQPVQQKSQFVWANLCKSIPCALSLVA